MEGMAIKSPGTSSWISKIKWSGGYMRFSPLKLFISSILIIGLLFLMAIPVGAQSRAVRGKVTDDKDQPVIDAKITIEGTDVYRIFSTKTNKKGEYYYLLGLQFGVYRIVARKTGFQPAYKDQVAPEMREEAEVNFKLVPGQDYKLPWEMNETEKAQYKKQFEDQKQKKQFSAEVKERFEKGVALFGTGQYNEALAEFNAALEKDAQQPGILARIGDCYAKLENNGEALAAYNKAIAMSPNDTSLYTNKGVILNKMGKSDEAQEMFKKAAELNPMAAAQNFYNLGVTMVNAGETEKAVDAFKRAIAADPSFAEAYYQMGLCLLGKPETTSAATEALNKYIQIGQKPDQVEVAKQIIGSLGTK
jgi:tetratricopeptide (TPR) repeat protein